VRRLSRVGRRWVGTFAMILGVVAVISSFFFYDRHNELTRMIQSWGWLGILCAILIMGCICSTPIPSEGLLLLYLKVFGVTHGVLYAWTGAMLSAVFIFFFARYYGSPLVARLLPPQRFRLVDEWIKKRGIFGLVIARLLPVPAFVVNYLVGLIPSVSFSNYMWTAAITVIPYYLGASMIYLGATRMLFGWAVLGVVGLALLSYLGHVLNKSKKSELPLKSR